MSPRLLLSRYRRQPLRSLNVMTKLRLPLRFRLLVSLRRIKRRPEPNTGAATKTGTLLEILPPVTAIPTLNTQLSADLYAILATDVGKVTDLFEAGAAAAVRAKL